MGRLGMIGVVGGLFLSMAFALWWQTTSLNQARSEVGRLESEVDRVADINKGHVIEIRGLTDSLNKLVEERELEKLEAEEAIRELELEEKAAAAELAVTRHRLQELYDGDCESWANIPVCTGVERELRGQ